MHAARFQLVSRTRFALALAMMSVCLPAAAAEGDRLGPEFKVNGPRESGNDPAVAYAGNGDFVVAWSGEGVRVRRYAANGAPRGPIILVADGGSPVDVAVSPNGKFVVAWRSGLCELESNDDCVFARRYTAGGVPRDASPILMDRSARFHQQVRVATDAAGDFVTAMAIYDDRSCRLNGSIYYDATLSIRATRYSAATGRVRPVEPSLGGNLGSGNSVDVAMEADGEFAIALPAYPVTPSGGGCEIGEDSVNVFRFSADGRLVSTLAANTDISGRQFDPSIAFDRDGDFYVAWREGAGYGADAKGIFARHFSAAGVPQTVADIAVSAQGYEPVIAPDGRSGLVVAWTENPVHEREVFLRRFDENANPIDAARQHVKPPTAGFLQRVPAIASFKDEHLVVVWNKLENDDGGSDDVVGQRFSGRAFDDISPRPFSFALKVAPYPTSLVWSDRVTVRGLGRDGAVISVSREPGTVYQVNNRDSSGNPGRIRNGDRLRVRALAAEEPGTVQVRVTVGDYVTRFRVRTPSGQ